IHVPLQSPEIKKPREALLSPGATGNGCRAKHLHVDRQFGQNKLRLTTTYCGYLSQMDTHFIQNDGGVGGSRCPCQVESGRPSNTPKKQKGGPTRSDRPWR